MASVTAQSSSLRPRRGCAEQSRPIPRATLLATKGPYPGLRRQLYVFGCRSTARVALAAGLPAASSGIASSDPELGLVYDGVVFDMVRRIWQAQYF